MNGLQQTSQLLRLPSIDEMLASRGPTAPVGLMDMAQDTSGPGLMDLAGGVTGAAPAARHSSPQTGSVGMNAPIGELRSLARQLTRDKFGPGQFQYINKIVSNESGWQPDAANPTSSARGLPQAMMSVHFGDDWKTDPRARKFLHDPRTQLQWMMAYIKGRFGTPKKAWQARQRVGTY